MPHFPSPEQAGAFGLVIGSTGATSRFTLTPLMTVDQGLDSLRRAGEIRGTHAPPLTVSLVEQAMPAR